MINLDILMVILGTLCTIACVALLIVVAIAPIVMLCELLKEIFKDKEDHDVF